MLRLPNCGFARRVDDTVARAMAILNTLEDYTARRVSRLASFLARVGLKRAI
jgi:hypothetical protein